MSTKTNEEDWGAWDASRKRKLLVGLEATPAQRLAWLEEMIALAHRVGALPRRKPDPTSR